MKVKNLSKSLVRIAGMPAFESSEIREVTDEEGSLLLRNENFSEVKDEKKKDSKAPDAE